VKYLLTLIDTSTTNPAIISKTIADKLRLKLGDSFTAVFWYKTRSRPSIQDYGPFTRTEFRRLRQIICHYPKKYSGQIKWLG